MDPGVPMSPPGMGLVGAHQFAACPLPDALKFAGLRLAEMPAADELYDTLSITVPVLSTSSISSPALVRKKPEYW